jgi:hypothetical protein
MAPERCPTCQSDRASQRHDPRRRPDLGERCERCQRRVTAHDQATLAIAVSHRLARAWISLGTGGLTVFLASTVFALGGHYVTFAWLASLGGTLLVRGFRVVSKPRRQLIQLAARAALPAARVVP